MSNKAVKTILRKSTRKDCDSLNIISYSAHERYQSGFGGMPHTFWLIEKDSGTKSWNFQYGPLPHNHNILYENQLPHYISPDLILVHNISANLPSAIKIAQIYNIPIISLWHVLPPQNLPTAAKKRNREQLHFIKRHVFISDYSRAQWGWDEEQNADVIKHCINSQLFTPNQSMPKNQILSVANDFIGRNHFLGFDLWRNIVNFKQSNQLPIQLVGDTPPISSPAKSVGELVSIYQNSSIFLNTSLISPIPCVILEAMSCGLAVVSTNTAMIPEYIEHGVNGLLYPPDKPDLARQYLKDLFNNPYKAAELGANARKTILEKCSIERFQQEWNRVFYEVANDN